MSEIMGYFFKLFLWQQVSRIIKCLEIKALKNRQNLISAQNYNFKRVILIFNCRYYAVECMELHKNSSNGEYWANATSFVFSKFLDIPSSKSCAKKPSLKNQISTNSELHSTMK